MANSVVSSNADINFIEDMMDETKEEMKENDNIPTNDENKTNSDISLSASQHLQRYEEKNSTKYIKCIKI